MGELIKYMEANKLIQIADIIRFNLENLCDLFEVENNYKGLNRHLLISATKNGKPFIRWYTHTQLEEMFDTNTLNAKILELRGNIFTESY